MNWYPIEIAPLEKPILISDGKLVTAAEACRLRLDRPLHFNPVGFWASDVELDVLDEKITHWAPLPQPPK